MRMLRYLLALAIGFGLTSCGESGTGSSVSVTAPGVRLTSFKVEAGKISKAQLKQGLQAAADTLSAVYAQVRKAHPQLKGHLRGMFHIEPDGKPRIFAEQNSEFTPAEGKSVSQDFIGATFGGKWQFPRVGNDLMVTVDFELTPDAR